jgi:PTH2 family peptidyl-tRNA hydrolase
MTDHPAPTTANIAIACALIAGITGYFIGQAKSLGLFRGSPISEPARSKRTGSDGSEESSDEEAEDTSDLGEFPGHNEECKMVLVVRTDLGMTKGIYSVYYLIPHV